MVMVVLRLEDAIAGSHAVELLGCDAAGAIDPAVAKVSGTLDAARLEAVLAMKDVEAAGTELYAILTGSAPGAAWKALGAQHGSELRTVFEIASPLLRKLPWEAMQDGAQCVFALQSCAIGTSAPAAATIARAWREPLRVLLVVGCAPDDTKVKWAEELRGVRQTLLLLGQAADEEVLRRPSISALAAKLKSFLPHVLHFIGHGGIDPLGKPALEMWNEGKTAIVSWDARQILLTLKKFQPRVVFLNACHSADQEDVAFDLAHAFQQAGVAAVVGMSGEVQGEAAVIAARHVYEALTGGQPLDKAVCEARGQIAMHDDANVQKDWWRPRLLVSTSLDAVLAPPPVARLEPPRFVDRKQPRRDLLASIAPAAEVKKGAVLAVVGEDGIGKTELLRWCLAACSVRGHLDVYVDLKVKPTLDTLGVLDAIRAEVVRAEAVRAAPAGSAAGAAFRSYLWAAEHLRSGREVPPLTDASAVAASVTGLLGAGDEKMVQRIFAAFREALATAAQARPIALGLDHPVQAAIGAVAGHLVPHLLGPIHRGEVPRVSVFTAATKGELDALGLAAVSHAQALDRFAPAEWRELAEDLACVANLQEDDDMIRAFEKGNNGKPWMPSRLTVLSLALVPK